MAVGAVRGFVLDVNDLPLAEQFWAAVTGLPLHHSARGSFSQLGIAEENGTRLLLQLVHDAPQTTKARGHLDITVRDLDAAIAEVCSLGGTLLEGPRRKDTFGGAIRWAVLSDPFKNEFCLVQDLIV